MGPGSQDQVKAVPIANCSRLPAAKKTIVTIFFADQRISVTSTSDCCFNK